MPKMSKNFKITQFWDEKNIIWKFFQTTQNKRCIKIIFFPKKIKIALQCLYKT